MNKKFLSAILFGALMVTSTGTFVSCKDYDDDIDRIDKELTEVKSQIAALQKLVGEGKWVTNITSIENGFTVTMSDGTSQNVTGIKGADGKNGTEWTIGEDGFWYMDGEKTSSQAVAKDGEDGKAGATAPSPKINADGFWVVYELDATTGEFVEKTTEISAQGTSAYVVKKDGVYVLHIADETGAFQDVILPATSDSFVVEAPAAVVNVNFDYAKWNPTTSNKDYKTLAAKFTAISSIEKNSLVKQGGNLPVLVTPASVELTDDYSYSLQTVNGKTPDITVSSPTKGLPAGTTVNNGGMNTRSASASDCFWTLKIEPGIDKKQYVQIKSESASLVVENAKGTVVKTAFAYKVSANDKSAGTYNVSVSSTGSTSYASEIDLLAYDEETNSYPVTISNEYTGYHIITLSNSYEVEKYGLSIAEDGKTLKIANMPSDVTSITIHLNVVALGLNGSTANQNVTLTVGQEVAATGSLADKALTLDGKNQTIKWNIADLGLSAVELDKVLSGRVNMTATREYIDASTNEVKATAYNGTVTYYNAAGNATAYKGNGNWSNGAATTLGITINASSTTLPDAVTDYPTQERWAAPAEYTLKLSSTSGTAVVYSAEATLTTSLPTISDSYIRLAAGYTEGGILQITGTVTPGTPAGIVSYNLNDALVLNGVTVLDFEDMDYNTEDHTDATLAASYNWVTNATAGTLEVNTWVEKDVVRPWYAAKYNQLYTTRNLRANIYFFNNPANVDKFDFKATVKSTIYSTTPSSAVTMTAAKLVSNYGGDAIDIKAAIAKAVYVAGPKKGQAYSLFSTVGKTEQKDVTDYDAPKVDGGFLVNSSTLPVQIETADLTKFGLSAADYTALTNTDKFYLKEADQTGVGQSTSSTLVGWSTIMTTIDGIYEYENGTWKQIKKDADLTADESKYKELFNKYIAKIAFDTKKVTVTTTATSAGAGVKAVSLEFVDAKEAAKYVNTTTLADFSVKPLAVADLTVDPKEVTVPMNLVVLDDWGMTMKVPFNITVKTTK
ncbi:PL29 family lyase N-terminal domain-containing protein [Phocaeicola sp.]